MQMDKNIAYDQHISYEAMLELTQIKGGVHSLRVLLITHQLVLNINSVDI